MAGKVFISYRRDDDPSAAARVRDALAARFGKSSLFMDVDSLSAGQRFEAELANALTACDVFIAIIGPRWMDLLRSKSQMSGLRDFVRDEIALALRRKIMVVPVRVGRENNLPPLPRAKDLPSDIRDLVNYQKHDVVHENFARDIAELAEAITRVRRSRRRNRPFPWAWACACAAASIVLSLAALVYVLPTNPVKVTWAPSAHALTTGSVPQTQPSRSASSLSPPTTDCDRLAAAPSDPNAVAPAVNYVNLDHGRAAVACEDATARHPDVARFWFQLGRAHDAASEADRAMREYSRAIELDPKYAFAYINRGNIYSNKNDYDLAITDYTRAIELDPKSVSAYNNRGNAYYRKNDHDRAITDYNKAIELSPKYAVAYDNRGDAYRGKNDHDRAIADYNKAIELDPKYAFAYNGRGIAYRSKGDNDSAIANFSKAIELNPKYAVAYINRGNIYGSKNDYDRAIADFTRAIDSNPKYALAYRNRGIAYAQLGRKEEAMANFQKVLELEPNDQDSKAWLNRLAASSSSSPDFEWVKDLFTQLGTSSSSNSNTVLQVTCYQHGDQRRCARQRVGG